MKMFPSGLVLLFLLSGGGGGGAFFIHDTQSSRCLEDGAAGLTVTQCDLQAESQQWIWINQAMLMCLASSRCLWAGPGEPARTLPCGLQQMEDADADGLLWDCERDRLVSRNSSMLLAVVGHHLVLLAHSQTRWRSLDQGDICQETLRLRRASDDDDEFEEERRGELAAMSQEQRELLQWFYRTEDPTTWKFVLLGAAFVCLLVGFLLLGMGSMANRSRKKIAKYKAAASLAQRGEDQELQSFPGTSSHSELQRNHLDPAGQDRSHLDPAGWDRSEPKAGNIVVTWKDGNTSCLYSDHTEEQEKQEGKEEEREEQEGKEEELEEQERKGEGLEKQEGKGEGLEDKQTPDKTEEQDQVTSESSSPGK